MKADDLSICVDVPAGTPVDFSAWRKEVPRAAMLIPGRGNWSLIGNHLLFFYFLCPLRVTGNDLERSLVFGVVIGGILS